MFPPGNQNLAALEPQSDRNEPSSGNSRSSTVWA